MRAFDVPYSRTRAIRVFPPVHLGVYESAGWGFSGCNDYGIPTTCIKLGRWGYVQIYWKAVR